MSIGKPVWTEADFDQMNWHDANVHGIAFREEAGGADLLLDIDYIARWIEPVPPSEYFTFLVAPATLVFRDVWSIDGGLGTQRTLPQIDRISRRDAQGEQQAGSTLVWVVEGDVQLEFLAAGFRQHFRDHPISAESQMLTLAQRGGISFAEPTHLP